MVINELAPRCLVTLSLFFLLLVPGLSLRADSGSPFHARLQSVLQAETGRQFATAHFEGPQDGALTAFMIRLEVPDGHEAVPVAPLPEMDANGSYPANCVIRWEVVPPTPSSELRLCFQGCVGALCYMPQEVGSEEEAPADVVTTHEANEQRVDAPLDGFRISAPLVGYADEFDFTQWLDRETTALYASSAEKAIAGTQESPIDRALAHGGWLLATLLTIVLGVLLNLTPCVLPMIPVTLGILGARGTGGGAWRGAALGGCYGAAMAIAYGAAGSLAVALGGRFGAINSNALFQFAMAVLFVLLALAMFDCIHLDFSRFRKTSFLQKSGPFAAAALLGAMAALLAGACIAPVLLWVLLLAAKSYAAGHTAALLLPLVLGVGLGLPWPFLGAGIGALPKPGPWMEVLKRCVGVMILLFALLTAWNGVKLWKSSHARTTAPMTAEESLPKLLSQTALGGKPILLDFWGVSCKACTLMDNTTLRSPRTKAFLEENGIAILKIQGDDDGQGAALARALGIVGFPTYYLVRLDESPLPKSGNR